MSSTSTSCILGLKLIINARLIDEWSSQQNDTNRAFCNKPSWIKCEKEMTYEFVYVVCTLYQISERRQVHADSDHAAGEAQLAELSVSLWKVDGEIEPTTGQHHPCCKSLVHHLPLKRTHRSCVIGMQSPSHNKAESNHRASLCRSKLEPLLTFCFV